MQADHPLKQGHCFSSSALSPQRPCSPHGHQGTKTEEPRPKSANPQCLARPSASTCWSECCSGGELAGCKHLSGSLATCTWTDRQSCVQARGAALLHSADPRILPLPSPQSPALAQPIALPSTLNILLRASQKGAEPSRDGPTE